MFKNMNFNQVKCTGLKLTSVSDIQLYACLL